MVIQVLNITLNLVNPQSGKEEKVIIKKIRRCNLSVFTKLQRSLLEEFVFNNGAAGTTLANDVAWSLVEKMSEVVPLEPSGYLKDYIEVLEDNLNVVYSLFLSGSWDLDTGEFKLDEEAGSYKPSLLYELNSLDYSGDIKKGIQAVQERILKEEKQNSSKTQKKETVTS